MHNKFILWVCLFFLILAVGFGLSAWLKNWPVAMWLGGILLLCLSLAAWVVRSWSGPQ